MSMMRRLPVRGVAGLATVAAVLVTLASPAAAAEGNIDHVEVGEGKLRVLYSIPGLGESVLPDLTTVTATIDGKRAPAKSALAANSSEGVSRTTILAIDVSNSMRTDGRFTEAKKAAQIFLETAPLDVLVGIVSFADQVEVVQEPTLDRERAVGILADLTLSRETRLYDGLEQAVRTAGSGGQRNVLLLSDGVDTSDTPLTDVTSAVRAADVQVDVISLDKSTSGTGPLGAIAAAGRGTVLSAEDPEALSTLFAEEAQALARQVLVTVDVPKDLSAAEGTLSVTIDAGDETFTDSAFVPISKPVSPGTPGETGALKTAPSRLSVPPEVMIAGLAATGLAALVLLASAFGVLSPRRTESIEDRISAYTMAGEPGRRRANKAAAANHGPQTPSVTTQAVGIAQRALTANKGFEAALGAKLEAAGLSLKPAEWLLAHTGLALGASLLGFLLSGGNLLFIAILLTVGAVGPYLYLGMKRSRRVKAFNAQLPDTLQLMSGSLSAGLSLAQSADTVVREGTEPMASELKRALIEARLGVQFEEGLDSIAQRMQSDDFKWVVMAIRIQREVGGNLAELLLQVAATMREREYLRRQVKALSAEGRMSAWILGALPPVFFVYLLLVRGQYLEPMLHSPLGWLMFGMAAIMMSIGAFWMSRVVKVEV